MQLACRLLFVDMEGLNDGRAVKTIVPQVNPRKMVWASCIAFTSVSSNFTYCTLQIIVHTPSDATDILIESCANIRAMTRDIFAPGVGESIQIGQQTSSFSISISDELLATMKLSRVSGVSIDRLVPTSNTYDVSSLHHQV